MSNKKDELEITKEEIQRMDRTELTGYIKGVNSVLENIKTNQDFYANKREIANERLRELIKITKIKSKPLPDVASYFELTKMYELRGEDLKEHQKIIKDLTENNQSQAACIRKMEKEITDLNKMYPIDPDNPTVELSVYEETCEELKLSKQKIEFWLNKEKPELQKDIAELTKDLFRIHDENKDHLKTIEQLKKKLS